MVQICISKTFVLSHVYDILIFIQVVNYVVVFVRDFTYEYFSQKYFLS